MSDSGNNEDGEAINMTILPPDYHKKSKYVNDLSVICDVSQPVAKELLEKHDWDIQAAIDEYLGGSDSDESIDEVQMEIKDEGSSIDESNNDGVVNENQMNDKEDTDESLNQPSTSVSLSSSVVSERADDEVVIDVRSPGECKKETEVEIELPLTPGGSTNFSTWAPEKFSIISWNVDGLDEKNLEKRMAAVVDLINTEKHGVVFLQELLPHTFEYIARRLSNYHPIVGTEDPKSEYFTATFLRLQQVYYEDHYLIPYPGTAMGRNILVTKAFIGRAKLALLNTHLESTGDFAVERTSQLKQCFQLCSSFPPNYNVIFGGDLNLRDKEVGGNLPQNMEDLWMLCGSRPTCKYTWDLTRNTNKQMPSKYQPKCRFDRLYFRDSVPKTLQPEFFGVTGIEKVFGTQSFPSDHWAIISFFRLEKEARKPLPKKRKAEECSDDE